MQCNIDARGKRARFISGCLCMIVAVVVWVMWNWIAGLVIALAAGFQIFEARQGWCVMRAMGFKTPM